MANVEVGESCSGVRRNSDGNGYMKLEVGVAGSRPVEDNSRRDKGS